MVLMRDGGGLGSGLSLIQDQDCVRSRSTISWPGSKVSHQSGSGQVGGHCLVRTCGTPVLQENDCFVISTSG